MRTPSLSKPSWNSLHFEMDTSIRAALQITSASRISCVSVREGRGLLQKPHRTFLIRICLQGTHCFHRQEVQCNRRVLHHCPHHKFCWDNLLPCRDLQPLLLKKDKKVGVGNRQGYLIYFMFIFFGGHFHERQNAKCKQKNNHPVLKYFLPCLQRLLPLKKHFLCLSSGGNLFMLAIKEAFMVKTMEKTLPHQICPYLYSFTLC